MFSPSETKMVAKKSRSPNLTTVSVFRLQKLTEVPGRDWAPFPTLGGVQSFKPNSGDQLLVKMSITQHSYRFVYIIYTKHTYSYILFGEIADSYILVRIYWLGAAQTIYNLMDLE